MTLISGLCAIIALSFLIASVFYLIPAAIGLYRADDPYGTFEIAVKACILALVALVFAEVGTLFVLYE